jgi:probable F420-dependent oxidoreductase
MRELALSDRTRMKFTLTLAFTQPEVLCEIAQTAEAYGWDAISVSDHVVNLDEIDAKYPYSEDGVREWDHSAPRPDVWVSIAMMAAVTQRLEFLSSVYILPMRDPFQVAKAVGTLAIMSKHRVNLGIGLGWMHDEFAVLGAPFAQRGRRTDEMVEVMRKLWTGELVEHHGEFYDFAPLSMAPGVGRTVPIIVGGVSDHALERTARIGDGWAPAFLSIYEVKAGIAKIHELRKQHGREGLDLRVFTSCIDAVDLQGYRRVAEIGVTHMAATPWIDVDRAMSHPESVKGVPLETILDSLKRFSDDVIAKMR